MGRVARGKKTKHNHIVRTIAKETERTVRRNELDTIASICGTTRNQVGEVLTQVETSDWYENDNDKRAEYDERGRTDSSSSISATAVSDD